MTSPAMHQSKKSRRDRASRLRRMLLMPVLALGVGLWLSDAYGGRKADHERFAASRIRELASQYCAKRAVSPGSLPTTASIAPIDPILAGWLVSRWEAAEGPGTVVVELVTSPKAAVAEATLTLRVVVPGDGPIELDATVIDGIVHVLAVRDADGPADASGTDAPLRGPALTDPPSEP